MYILYLFSAFNYEYKINYESNKTYSSGKNQQSDAELEDFSERFDVSSPSQQIPEGNIFI